MCWGRKLMTIAGCGQQEYRHAERARHLQQGKGALETGHGGITTVIPTLGRQKQEDYEFEVSLGYKHTRK